jgi:hypothetical protein
MNAPSRSLCFLAAVLLLPSVPAAAPSGRAAGPAKGPEAANDVPALLKARLALAEKGYREAFEGLKRTRRVGNVLTLVAKPDEVYAWSVRWLQAQRALSPKHEDQVAALEAHLRRMTKLQERVKELVRDLTPASKADEAEWYRLEAQLWLAKAKAKPAKAG